MAVEIRVPSVGESVVEATVARWIKKVGDTVAIGDEVVELSTDKATNVLFAEAAGTLEQILRKENEDVGVGDVLGIINDSAIDSARAVQPAPRLEEAALDRAVASSNDGASHPGPSDNGRGASPISPLAARIAVDKGVDVAHVVGSGTGGRVMRQDVERAAHDQPAAAQPVAPPLPAAEPAPPAEQQPPRPIQRPAPPAVTAAADPREDRLPMSRRRQSIARRLKEAQNTAAMLTTFNEVDMTAVMDLRKRRNEAFEKRNGVKLGFMSFFTKASVGALKAFPYLNAEIQGDTIVVKRYYDIGIAVGAPEGLVVPVLRSADTKSFAAVEKEIKELAERARVNRISVPDLVGGTFTITNGGIFGSLLSTPILNYPQVGILGMHKIQERAIVIGGQVVARPMMYVALSYDHRIVDGSEAVRFLVRVKELIEDPETLLLEG